MLDVLLVTPSGEIMEMHRDEHTIQIRLFTVLQSSWVLSTYAQKTLETAYSDCELRFQARAQRPDFQEPPSSRSHTASRSGPVFNYNESLLKPPLQLGPRRSCWV